VICVSDTLTGEAEREGETHEKKDTTFLKIKDTHRETGESPGNLPRQKKKGYGGYNHNNNVVPRYFTFLFSTKSG